MSQVNGTLRFEIDGQWSVANMIVSLQEVSYLYNIRLYLNHIEEVFPEHDDWYYMRKKSKLFIRYPYSPVLHRPDVLRELVEAYFPESELQIARIQYASPGFKDFFGFGECLQALGNFLKSMITLSRDLEAKTLQNNAQRIENARSFVRLRLEHARAEREISGLQIDKLAEKVEENTRGLQLLIESGLITDVRMLEEKLSERE